MFSSFIESINQAASGLQSAARDLHASSSAHQQGPRRQQQSQPPAQPRPPPPPPPPPPPQRKVPPASRRAIQNLVEVKVTADDLWEETNKECLVCVEEQRLGSTACKLSCGHLYHRACLVEWLQKHCTCPVCRYELETDDIEYERERKGRMQTRKMRFRMDELKAKKVSQLRDVATTLLVNIAGCMEKSEVRVSW